jgi:hypothetical protein
MRQPPKTYTVELRYDGSKDPNLRCANQGSRNPVLNLTVHLVGPMTDSSGTFSFYR